jgi:hypothetical protein
MFKVDRYLFFFILINGFILSPLFFLFVNFFVIEFINQNNNIFSDFYSRFGVFLLFFSLSLCVSFFISKLLLSFKVLNNKDFAIEYLKAIDLYFKNNINLKTIEQIKEIAFIDLKPRKTFLYTFNFLFLVSFIYLLFVSMYKVEYYSIVFLAFLFFVVSFSWYFACRREMKKEFLKRYLFFYDFDRDFGSFNIELGIVSR